MRRNLFRVSLLTSGMTLGLGIGVAMSTVFVLPQLDSKGRKFVTVYVRYTLPSHRCHTVPQVCGRPRRSPPTADRWVDQLGGVVLPRADSPGADDPLPVYSHYHLPDGMCHRHQQRL